MHSVAIKLTVCVDHRFLLVAKRISAEIVYSMDSRLYPMVRAWE